jgi:hypothetical protein
LELAETNLTAEKARSQELAATLREVSAKLEEAQKANPTAPQSPSSASPQPTPPPVNMWEIQGELERIAQGFSEDFSGGNLEQIERMPTKALDLLNKRIEETAAVLLKAPQSVRGWMNMGFLRLSALEFKSAAQSFDKAIANHKAMTAGGQRGGMNFIEFAAPLRDFARENSNRRPEFGKNGPTLADPLRRIAHPMTSPTIEAIRFFSSKPAMQKPLAPATSPMKREPSNNELALQLLTDNNLTTPPVVQGYPMNLDVTIEGNTTNISSIVFQTKSLTLRNAQQVDVQNLSKFTKLTKLDFSGSQITDPVPLPRMTAVLSSLNISNTAITDLAPLSLCMKISTLDAGGCRLKNLRPLQNMRGLRQLTISPELLQNPNELAFLRSLAIPSIRTPDEPKDQPASEFFRKHLPSNQN